MKKLLWIIQVGLTQLYKFLKVEKLSSCNWSKIWRLQKDQGNCNVADFENGREREPRVKESSGIQKLEKAR